jgi:spermidine synthase
VLAGRRAYHPPAGYTVATRFLTPETTPALFQFPKDMARVAAEVNRLNNQVLVRYFETEWQQVIR